MAEFQDGNYLADFESLSNLFIRLNTYSSPSELHGLTCGVICAGFLPSDKQWLDMVSAHLQLDLIPQDIRPSFVAFYGHSCAQLMEPGFEFQPFLPGDEYHLEQRLEALVDWCNGFLHGFGAMFKAGAVNNSDTDTTERTLDEDTQVILRDFSDIAKVQIDEAFVIDDASEENERYYVEVFEYIRVATLTLLAEHGALDEANHRKHSQSVH